MNSALGVEFPTSDMHNPKLTSKLNMQRGCSDASASLRQQRRYRWLCSSEPFSAKAAQRTCKTYDRLSCRKSGPKSSSGPALKRLNSSVQSAFVSCCLIFMHKTFSGHAVKHRNSCGIGFRRGSFITGTNCCNNSLDVSTHHRTHTRVTGPSGLCLSSTFFRLRGVRQLCLLGKLEIQPNSIVGGPAIVNRSGTGSSHDSEFSTTVQTRTSQFIAPVYPITSALSEIT